MKFDIKKIFILIFLISATSLWAKSWKATPATTGYYKEEFKKVYFHFGIGGSIGFSYYLNYSENNNFYPYIISIKLIKEIKEGEIGYFLKFDNIFETKEYTDESTYYGDSFREMHFLYIGINKKYKSFIPLTEWLLPYISIGGCKIEAEYHHSTANLDGYIDNAEIRGSGWGIGIDLGTDIELIENFLFLNIGMKYNCNFMGNIYRIIWLEENKEIQIKMEEQNEHYILFYTGFHYFLF